MKKKLVLAAATLSLVLIASTAARAQELEQDPRFGIVDAFWDAERTAELNVGWERILFYWSEIQPEGPEDWNTLHVMEEWLDAAHAANREVVGLLKHTPPWATDGVPYGGVPRGLYLPVDDPENLWANYVRRVAEYYAPRGVHHWIVWNEPDIAPGVYGNEWAGTVEDYYRLLKVAYLTMKQVDPEATIHLAGLTYWHDVNVERELYLERLLKVATADPDGAEHSFFFDVLTLHVYFRAETIPTIIHEIDALQHDYGLDKPIWINETNAAPTLDEHWPVERPQFEVDLAQQAWYLVQAHALGFAAGAERIAVYKFLDVDLAPGDEAFGLLRGDHSPRPAFLAHKTITRYMGHFEEVEQTSDELFFQVSFTRPGAVTRVLWAREPTSVTLELPAADGSADVISATGEAERVMADDGSYTISLDGARCYHGDCIIGGPPIYLVEETASPPAGKPVIVSTARATPMPADKGSVGASRLLELADRGSNLLGGGRLWFLLAGTALTVIVVASVGVIVWRQVRR